MQKFIILVFAVSVSLISQLSGQESLDLNEIARANFPPELRGVNGLARDEACAVAYPSASDVGLLAAGYVAGGMQMLKRETDGTYHRLALYAPPDLFLGGVTCTLDMVDLDKDGTPEIRLALSGGTGSEVTRDWYFRWNGSDFVNLTPVHDGDTDLLGTYTMDVDLDGKLEVIGLQPEPGGTINDASDFNAGQAIYVLDSSGLHKGKDITYSDWVQNTAGAPMAQEMTLSFRHPPNGNFRITIINGLSGGTQRASAGTVDVNGETVITPSDLNQNVATVTKTIQLKQSNVFHVTLDGPPGSQLSVLIEPYVAQD